MKVDHRVELVLSVYCLASTMFVKIIAVMQQVNAACYKWFTCLDSLYQKNMAAALMASVV